jgi:hypothetical protein
VPQPIPFPRTIPTPTTDIGTIHPPIAPVTEQAVPSVVPVVPAPAPPVVPEPVSPAPDPLPQKPKPTVIQDSPDWLFVQRRIGRKWNGRTVPIGRRRGVGRTWAILDEIQNETHPADDD